MTSGRRSRRSPYAARSCGNASRPTAAGLWMPPAMLCWPSFAVESIEIQRQLAERNAALSERRRMCLRIGLNLGDVIEQDGALYGDGVNIAARLEAMARPGGICLSGNRVRPGRRQGPGAAAVRRRAEGEEYCEAGALVLRRARSRKIDRLVAEGGVQLGGHASGNGRCRRRRGALPFTSPPPLFVLRPGTGFRRGAGRVRPARSIGRAVRFARCAPRSRPRCGRRAGRWKGDAR
jgi:hypothetical protein